MTGESPVVDTQSTTLSASFNKDALEKIPTARDPWVIIEQTPGMIMSGENVGGNLSGQQTSFSAMGSGTNQQWKINGAVISDIASGNSSPTYYDFDSFEEIQITTGGADASQQGAGVQVNFITESGSNKLHRLRPLLQHERQVFRQVGLPGEQRHRRHAQSGAAGGNPIQNIRDYGRAARRADHEEQGLVLGRDVAAGCSRRRGRLLRHRRRPAARRLPPTRTPRTPTGPIVNSIESIKDCLFGDLTTLKNNNARLQYQESAGHQTSFSYTYGDKYRGSRGCDAFHPLITCSVQTGPTIFYSGDHRWIVEQCADDHRPVPRTSTRTGSSASRTTGSRTCRRSTGWTRPSGTAASRAATTTRSGRRTTSGPTATTSRRTSWAPITR